MLDTNTISELVRHPNGHVAQKVIENEHLGLCTSIIVSSELRFGVAKNKSERLRLQVDTILSGFDVLPFEHPADYHYGRIRAELHSIGKIIGPNDILIAAHAYARGTILVTNNLKEFSRVPGLKAESWL